MKKAKEIFWSLIELIFWIPWVLITFAILPFIGFTFAKSIGDSGFYGAKEAVETFSAEICKLLKTDVPEEEA